MTNPVIDLFTTVAPSYDEVIPFFAAFGTVFTEQLPTPAPGAKLLDIGAGRGAIAIPARTLGYAVTATDASSGMVDALRAQEPDLDVRLMDAARLDFDDATFDVVTAGFVMHLLDDPGAAIREVLRVLKPGGLFAFTILGRVPVGFARMDSSSDLFGEYAQYLPPSGSMGTPFDAIDALAGFDDVNEMDIQVELPVDDPETFWRWFQTHGTRKFFDELDDVHREEFHQRLIADLSARDHLVLRRYAWFYRATKPRS